MKRILIATGLTMGLLAATANEGRAAGCGLFGPGYFSIGLKLEASWGGLGGGGGCGGGCHAPGGYPPPAVYGAAPYGYPAPAYGYGGPVGDYGYGAPAADYGYGGHGAPVADYGHGGGYGY